MPEVARDVHYILKLYSRCQQYHCLPYAGGILNQPAWIMDLFSVIENRQAAHDKEAAEKQEMENALKAK